jgi:hypothetical protein
MNEQYANSIYSEDLGEIQVETIYVDLKNKGRIDDILEKLKIDPVVKDLTRKYYENLDINTIRLESKLKAVFYCALVAQEDLGEQFGICPALDLAKELGLDKKKCESAIKKYHGRLGDKKPIGYVEPIIIIRSIARQKGWSDKIIHEITNEWNSLIRVSPQLNEIQPMRIAAAYLHYYITSNGYTANSSEFMTRFKINKKQFQDAEQMITNAISLLRSENKW